MLESGLLQETKHKKIRKKEMSNTRIVFRISCPNPHEYSSVITNAGELEQTAGLNSYVWSSK